MIPIREFIVTTAPGLEPLLEEELKTLGLSPRLEPSGTARLTGGWDVAAAVLIHSRIASRLLLPVREFAARNRAMLYDQVRRVAWSEYFGIDKSFAVHAHGSVRESDFVLSYAPLRIKDAVCDEFRKVVGDRPNVDRQNPEVRIEAFFFNGRCELSLDLSGAPLHRRGYRKDGSLAPLREDRAAALLAFSGYDGSQPLIDPFCGSGTIPIEAALIATGIAPGLLRPVEAFSLPRLFPEARSALLEARQGAEAARRTGPPASITGMDVSETALATARSNAIRAGVASWLKFERADARTLTQPGSWLVTNPPYGERLSDIEGAASLLNDFVRQVKHHASGSRLTMVLPEGRLEKSVGLRPSRKLRLESGPNTLRFLVFDVYAGSRKQERSSET